VTSQPLTPTVVEEYLAALEGERGEATRTVFETVHAAMPVGYELGDFRGAPHWFVPFSRVPVTYNGQPLAYTTLIAQKNYTSLYLSLHAMPERYEEFQRDWAARGLKLDMGKSCLRFRSLADVDLSLIAEAVAVPVDEFVATYERSRQT